MLLRRLLRRWPSGRRRRRGQSLVEFALVAPVFLLLLLTAIDLGRLVYSQVVITNAAKEGALVASQGGTFQANQPCGDANTIMCGVLSEARGGFVEVDQARVTVPTALCEKNAMYPSTGTPPTVIVNVSAPFRVITPIIGGIVGSNLQLGGSATAQCLVVPAVSFPSTPDPVAAFTVSPSSTGTAPFTVTFDGTSSSTPTGTITDYAWSFGSTTAVASRTYPSAGTFIVTLTVTNSFGNSATSAPITITVTPPSGPTCAPITLGVTAVDNHNGGHPHRMQLSVSPTPPTSGITYAWTLPTATGTTTSPGASVTYDFPSSGSQSVSVTGTKGTCTYSSGPVAVTAP